MFGDHVTARSFLNITEINTLVLNCLNPTYRKQSATVYVDHQKPRYLRLSVFNSGHAGN